MFCSADILRTSSPDTASQITLKDCSEEAREEPGSAGVFAKQKQKTSGENIKRLLLIKENQISQVKEFSASLCMGRYKIVGSLESFL